MREDSGGKRMITAGDIIELLAAKHSHDLFVPQCKIGSTCMNRRDSMMLAARRDEAWRPGGLQMDAWAMRKSWTGVCSTGYEVKISRSDFRSDKKWEDYLPHCNAFYFVSPPEVIRASDLPKGVGLMWVTKTGRGLVTRVKSEVRDANLTSVMRYVLMWRVRPCRARYDEIYDFDRAGYWRQWLAAREDDRKIGMHVSESLRRIHNREVGKRDKRIRELESRLKINVE